MIACLGKLFWVLALSDTQAIMKGDHKGILFSYIHTYMYLYNWYDSIVVVRKTWENADETGCLMRSWEGKGNWFERGMPGEAEYKWNEMKQKYTEVEE